MTKEFSVTARPSVSSDSNPVRTFAVIELGTTAIRMVIAEVNPDGSIKVLESLQQTVLLGKDAFSKRFIDPSTIEDCVRVLRSYIQVFSEFGIQESNVKAVATSAIREAQNREAVLDRIFVATGIDVEVLEDAEVSRYMYLAVAPALSKISSVRDSDVLVVEVGGGNTDILVLKKGLLASAQVFRMGAYRLRNLLEEQRAPAGRYKEIMVSHIDRALEQIRVAAGTLKAPVLLALGGDTRFATSRIRRDWDHRSTVGIPVSSVARLSEELLKLETDRAVKKYHISSADAETHGPALMVYARMAVLFGLKNIQVCPVTLREGILKELSGGGAWTEEYQGQIINSALELGQKFAFDRKHAESVAATATMLFDALKDEHRLEPRWRLLLNLSALLHETGHFISNRSHHKHSLYIVMNSDLFGLASRDKLITALVARYHRKAMPKPEHEVYSLISRRDRVIVSKLAAILRVADALERGRSHRIQYSKISIEDGCLNIQVKGVGDLALETYALQEKGVMFERIYGLKVFLKG